jgi:hypothetical protein
MTLGYRILRQCWTLVTSSSVLNSHAAYKAWMMELCKRLTTKEICIVLSEEEWIASWQAYWEEQSGG